MRWVHLLRSLPVRGKLLLTLLGAAIVVLGATTYLSFRYWSSESMAAAEQQALLAAHSTRTTLESAVRLGRTQAAHRAVEGLLEEGAVSLIRVHGEDGTVILSADHDEEGTRAAARWIPRPRDLPREGLARPDEDGNTMRVFVPLSLPEPAVLEMGFSVEATRAAMERGARLGIGLMAFSLLAVVGIVVTMFEREVVAPLHRIDVLLRRQLPEAAADRTRPDDLEGLERSVTRLVEEGRKAADRDRQMEDREGLAQVGELAAEMAHEFKRPLASIQTAIQVLEQEYELDTGGREVLGAVNGQLDRLYETMQDLFSLAKPVVLEQESVDLAETLDEALAELSGYPAMEGVEVRRAYSHEGITVHGDPRRLRQAFLNILANGAEAMSEGGLLTLGVRLRDDSAEVTFTDTGPGLDPEAVDRALKPFYSTKPTGTGLGLPLVARIIAAHRGGLAIESRPGKGTTVRITLPLVRPPVTGGG